MPRPEEPVNPDEGPLQEFAWELRQLRERAGRPTYQTLATKTNYSRATLAKAAGGKEKPTLDVVLAYVQACQGDRQEWRQKYRQLERALAASHPGEVAPARYRSGPRPPVVPERLASVLDDLARAVAEQWQDEERVWGLSDPTFGLPVRWAITQRPVTDHPDAGVPTADTDGPVAGLAGFLDRLAIPRLVILGARGSGKTACVIELVVSMLAARHATDPVPILVPASRWNPEDQSLPELLIEYLTTTYPALGAPTPNGETVAAELVRARVLVPVVDGLDEIAAALRGWAIRRINTELGTASAVVLTSCSPEYEEAVYRVGGDVLKRAVVVELQPLTAEDVRDYLRRATAPHRAARWDPVFSVLVEQPDGALATALSTPLMAWLAQVVFAHREADPKELLFDPLTGPSVIEDYLIDHLVPAVYAARGDSDAGPAAERADSSLRFLARYLSSAGTAQLAWWNLARVAPRFTGPAGVGLISGLVTGPLAGLVYGLTYGPIDGLLYAVGYIILSSLVYGLIAAFSVARAPLHTDITIRTSPGRYLRGLKAGSRAALASAGIVGPLTGLANGLVYGSYHSASAGLAMGLASGSVAGLASGLAVMLATGLTSALDTPTDIAHAASPISVLRTDRAAAHLRGWVVGIVVGVTAAIGSGLLAVALTDGLPYVKASQIFTVGSATGLIFGLGAGLTAALATAYGRFTLARALLVARGHLDWAVIGFLDDAHRRGILRQDGGAYQFRHARLQHRFAQSAGSAAITRGRR